MKDRVNRFGLWNKNEALPEPQVFITFAYMVFFLHQMVSFLLLHKSHKMNEVSKHHLHSHIAACNVAESVGVQKCVVLIPSTHYAQNGLFWTSLSNWYPSWSSKSVSKSPFFEKWHHVDMIVTHYNAWCTIICMSLILSEFPLFDSQAFIGRVISPLIRLSDFGEHGGENTSSAEIKRLSAEPKWCRAKAPLVAHTDMVIFSYLFTISPCSRVISHSYIFLLDTQFCSLI